MVLDSPPWPQLFLTRIVGSKDLPDVEILTVPIYLFGQTVPNLGSLRRQIMASGIFRPEQLDSDKKADINNIDYIKILRQVIDSGIKEELPRDTKKEEEYAEQIYSAQPLPVMNSPLSGESLKEIVSAAGAVAFMKVHLDATHVILYFVIVGGTIVVIGAANSISEALQKGMSSIFSKLGSKSDDTTDKE